MLWYVSPETLLMFYNSFNSYRRNVEVYSTSQLSRRFDINVRHVRAMRD
jgi:hypothetical protein